MNNKGFAASGILYTILLIFVVSMCTLLFNLQNRKTILDELKADAVNAVESDANYEYLLRNIESLKTELETLKSTIGTTDISMDTSKEAYQKVYTYGTQTGRSTGYYKISINNENAWMLSFSLNVYQSYKQYNLRISGYNYSTSYWYSPSVKNLGGETGITVTFGYDSIKHLWIAIPAEYYTGITISDIVNGYTQIDVNDNLFTIEYVTELSGTTQTTVTVS